MLPLHELFLKAISDTSIRLPGHEITKTDRWTLTIPAIDPEVGDLTVWDDGDELTIDIGRKHHSHFDEHTAIGSTKTERRTNAADSAAGFVNDVLNDSIAFRVEYGGGRCRSSTSWYPEHSDPGTPSTATDAYLEFRWSGVTNRHGT